MILPTKHLGPERSLLAISAEVLSILDEPKTVSRVWEEFSKSRSRVTHRTPVSYDWFVLSLNLLFILGTVEFQAGRISRVET